MRIRFSYAEEFLDELQSSALLSFSQKQLLGDFLMRCDLVKFAKHEPPVDQLQELYQSALRLIDETSVFLQKQTSPSQPEPPTRPDATPPAPPPAVAEKDNSTPQPS